ncbi:hypothetical protein KCP69_22985 [Salmonella enterica subsp. enterica]|nr:hypothetical protein KCP69_22985 [Salmonella enterica subsp. enterica]
MPRCWKRYRKRIPRISDDDVPLDNWRQAHDGACHYKASCKTLQERTTQEQQRAMSDAHF